MDSCDVRWCRNTHHIYYGDNPPRLQEKGNSSNICMCGPIEGDSDIAGIGVGSPSIPDRSPTGSLTTAQVISAFIAAAGLSILSTGLCLLLSRYAEGDAEHPTHREYAREHQKDPKTLPEPPHHFNAIDRFMRNHVCKGAQRLVRWLSGDPAILGACFYDSVIALGDQQIVTGIAMMIAAMIRKNDERKPLSTYHFMIVSDLVWFSSNAHLLALLVICSYDDSVKDNTIQRKDKARRKRSARFVRGVRAFLMSVLAIFLVCASIIADDVNLYKRFRCPAACLDTSADVSDEEPRQWMIINVFYVPFNYPVAILMLSRRFRVLWVNTASESIHRLGNFGGVWAERTGDLGAVLGNVPVGKELVNIAALSVALAGWVPYCFWTILSSEALAFAEVAIWFGLGTDWVIKDLQDGQEGAAKEQKQAERSWGFGSACTVAPLHLAVHAVPGVVRHALLRGRAREKGYRGRGTQWYTITSAGACYEPSNGGGGRGGGASAELFYDFSALRWQLSHGAQFAAQDIGM